MRLTSIKHTSLTQTEEKTIKHPSFSAKKRLPKRVERRLLSVCQKGASLLLKQKKKTLPTYKEPSFGNSCIPFLPLSNYQESISHSPLDKPVSAIALEIFARIGEEITVIDQKGSVKTTITLNSSQGDRPIRIIIEEFSTAPKLFNITVEGNPAILAAVSSEAASFMDFIHKKELSFGIHRIDTALSSEKNDPTKDYEQEERKKDE